MSAPVVRQIACGPDWRVSEHVCTAGPRDRPFEEVHSGFAIAAVLAGTFTYRSHAGRAVLHPNALLLGNTGAGFECSHDHSTGDRCIACHIAPELFAEIVATARGNSRFTFFTAMVPAAPSRASWIAALEASHPSELEDTVLRLVEAVVGSTGTRVTFASARDRRRIAEVVRHVETHASEPLDLERLAAMAGVSKYHFVRLFRGAIGTSPYQFVLALRMRRAAVRIARSRDPISMIAFECGFGDLSTFNHRFRDAFDLTPTAYRHARLLPTSRTAPC
jgi:AraC-like DNA-binding protein